MMEIRLSASAALLIVAMTLAGEMSAQRADLAEAALRAARDREVVDGNLPAAIKQYQAIVDRYGKTDRIVAATALMHMAECLQKLGDNQARSAYERIVREFADVSEIATTARVRLADAKSETRNRSGATLALRRIYDGPGIDWCNGLSSDARWLSHVDWTSGDIALADTRTGQVRRLTTTGSMKTTPREFGECSVFSPDDKQIAFYWTTKAGSELRVMTLDALRPRRLYQDQRYLHPQDWSPDGRFIVVTASNRNGPSEILSISTADGSARVVARGVSRSARISPNCRYIAYSAPTSSDSTKSDILLVAIDGTGNTALAPHPSDDYVLGWAADSSRVYFLSDRTGANSVWAIDVVNGQAAGSPVLIKPDLGAVTAVRTLNGTLYYTLRSELSDVYVASVDLQAGRVVSALSPAKKFASGSNVIPAWSPDGRKLAYRTMRGGGDPLAPGAAVSILDLESGEERTVKPTLDGMDFNDGPQWSPDGRSLIVTGMQNTPQSGAYKVDVTTGATTLLVKPSPGEWVHHVRWSPDGQSIFLPLGRRIVRHELATGTQTELARVTGGGGATQVAVSPDGAWLVFVDRLDGTNAAVPRALNIVSTQGGKLRELYRVGEKESLGSPTWSPDSRYVYFRKRPDVTAGPNPAARQMWRVTLDGVAERTALDLAGGSFAFSPDGSRVATTLSERKNELWALDLPPRR